MFKAFVYVFTFIFVGAFKLMGAIITGIGALIASGAQNAQQRREDRRFQEAAQAEADRLFEINLKKQEDETMRAEQKINSLLNQMEAEFKLADELRKKAAYEPDGVKRAELRRKAAQADARADVMADKIHKLQNK